MSEPIRVLHVDDEPDFAELAREYLEREDERFTVKTAQNASDGLERLTNSGFDCIISDYDMPGQNGIEFLERVRRDHPDLPFILYTGKGSEEVAGDAISAGVTDYLQKENGTDQYRILANRIQNTVEQYRATERAANLDRVRTLASTVNQALVRAESLEEAETRICEIISDSDPYLFAWIGEIDEQTDHIEPRASAGVGEQYLDDITITTDQTATGQGPGGTAIREQRIAVSQNIAEDPVFEPWREQALERGYQSVAAVPLGHNDTLYGELVVYADRPDAFDDTERTLLSELGDDIAHCLHSFEMREDLRKERDQRQALFENAPTPALKGDFRDEGDTIVLTAANDAFEEEFSHDAEEIIGEDPADFMIPDEEMAIHQEARKRAIAGETFTAEVDRFTANGPCSFLLHTIPYGTGDSPADGMFAWFTNISEQKERERSITELHDATNAIMEATLPEEIAEIATETVHEILEMPANGVHLFREEGGLRPVKWTEQAERIVGDFLTSQPGQGIVGSAVEAEEPRIYDDISSETDPHDPECSVRSLIVFPLGDHGAHIIGSSEPNAFDETDVFLIEIFATHMTTALDRLKHQQDLQLMEDIVHEINDGAVIAQDGVIQYTNPKLSDMLDYSKSEFVDSPIVEFIAPTDRETVLNRHHARIAGQDDFPNMYDLDLVAKDGTRIPFEIHVSQIEYEGQPATLSLLRDVSERKKRQQELEREQNRSSAIFEAIPEPVARVRFIGEQPIADTVNPAFEETFGYAEQVIEGRSLNDFIVPEDRRDEVCDMIQAGLNGSIIERDVERLTANGRRQFLFRGSILNHENKASEGIGIYVDVDERRERERAIKRQNERLEQFVSVVGHDLRNPLNVAKGRLEQARDECDTDHLDAVSDALDRSIALTEDLLKLAYNGEAVSDFEAVNLGDTIEGCWQTVETRNATLLTNTDRTTRANESRLKQLVENLLRNAIDHGGDEVTITIGDLEEGFYIADDGSGIPEEEREQVFETGYSTVEEGTGLGLNIAQEIATAHGWNINVTESQDGGARFEITDMKFIN